ncbi:GNAT family N-acetyltransferase [Photobacterium galatheae]|uniref:Protein ElaA n=1 Tax=Photobacterium galatheae TaxID=1654360 RepID=A0A066RSJ4_9GAMM|nr:GNAT family N-acetyltransferase [Photobacterium galatheae]KDM90368.1 GCN5 family acetyltransferase [Photobacterium galatheae]MCM0150753.1 GNAT family N-acetyltransferase [Photobacterium galatheae]
MQWQCLGFDQLTTDQLYDILKLRVDVFVVEQNCPYPEIDGHDKVPGVYHVVAYENDTLMAYLRLLPAGLTYDGVSIGRVITSEAARGRGLGSELLRQGLAYAEQLWPGETIEIGAQSHLQNYYGRFGFTAFSEEYLEDGIPHIDMRLTKNQPAA